MSKNHLTRILLFLFVCSYFDVLASAAGATDDDIDEDIYSTQANQMKKKLGQLDDEKFEVFQKIHDILVSLPSPIVDNLKLRKRVPVVIKMHEVLLKAFVKAVPKDVLKIDKNMAIMLLPVLIFILAQFVYMLRYIPLALISPFINFGPKKTTWQKKEFADKFSFDQIDQLGQIKAVSSEIQNAKLLLTQSTKSKPAGQGSNDASDELESIKQTLQQQLQTVNQLIQSVQQEISEQQRKRKDETAQLQSISTKIEFIFKTQQTNAQQTQDDLESIRDHVMSRTIKLQNSAKNGNNNLSITEQYKGKLAHQNEYLETEVATADQALKENEVDYYYSLPANQMMEGEDVEYYYDEEDEEEDEVQV